MSNIVDSASKGFMKSGMVALASLALVPLAPQVIPQFLLVKACRGAVDEAANTCNKIQDAPSKNKEGQIGIA